MSETNAPGESQEKAPVSKKRLMLPVIGTRRNFLINRRYQLRVTVLVIGTVAALLVLLNWALYLASAKSTLELVSVAPGIEERVRSQDRAQMLRLVVGSLVFLSAVFVMTVLETHKTAGAAFNIARHIRLVGEGDYARSLKLRRGDNLGELEAAYNDMRAAIEKRTRHEIATLERLANRADEADEAALAELMGELQRLAAEKRSYLES
jgi:methyl-accepting chemotaxis protein